MGCYYNISDFKCEAVCGFNIIRINLLDMSLGKNLSTIAYYTA